MKFCIYRFRNSSPEPAKGKVSKFLQRVCNGEEGNPPIQQYLVLEAKPQNMANKNQIQENQVVYIPTETPRYTLTKTTLFPLFPKHRSNAEISMCPEVGHLPVQELFFHQLGKS